MEGSENMEGSPEPSKPVAYVQIEATFAGKLNLADFQNAVPVLRELAVFNETDVDLKEVDLTVTSEPPFLKPKTWRLDAVGAGQRSRLSDLDVTLEGALLSRLTEAEKAVVTLSLHSRDDQRCELATKQVDIELLARNQWGGLAYMPDMVAAFVQPNDPAVERILKRAAELLRKAGKSGSIDGYQGGAKRAWELTSAIWSAVGAMGLDYSLPPASFEHTGQKVRGPSQIAESGLATCLDLALLFSAALEQAHLNPIIVFTRGHAFAGVWLKKEEFTTTVVDDVTALRKRVKLKEMVLFEATVVTERPVALFSYATERAMQQVSEEKEQSFELAVDIRRARLQRIKPLASSEAPTHATPGSPPAEIDPTLEEPPDLPKDTGDADGDDLPERPEDRLTRWQRKLLDLSLRNNLLNFKSSKKGLKLDAPDPSRLEDLLAEGHSLKLLPRPDLMTGNDPRNQAIHEGREHEDVRREHAPARMRMLQECVGVNRRTVMRWRAWWTETLVDTPFWRAAAGRFMAPLARLELPAALLERFAGAALDRLLALLRWLSPITTESAAVHAR